MQKQQQRETELDILRIIALLAVICVHVCGLQTDTLPSTSINWQIITVFSTIVTWQVPVYVMISGRFFLDPTRDVSFKKIIKSIWRLVFAFIIWDIVYQIYYILSGTYGDLNWKGILSQAVIGPYHFWYIHMLIWLYAITPFLRKITENKRLMEYFIMLFLLFEFIRNYGVELPFIGDTLSEILTKINFNFALGYSGYYILGYYLYKYKLPTKIEIPLYIVGIIMLAFTVTATLLRAIDEGVNNEWYSKYLLPNIVIEASAIYTLFVKRVSKLKLSDRFIRIITALSDRSFCVYLIHGLVLEFFAIIGFSVTVISPIIMIPVTVVLTFIICNVIVSLMRLMPHIGKKIT